MTPAIVLLSGGLDSATVLAIAQSQGFEPIALSFRYGQRHAIEIDAARRIAAARNVREHHIVDIDLRSIGGSSLTADIAVPKNRSSAEIAADLRIPSTYVPARNTIFMSFALAWAEVRGAVDIFVGINAIDYSGYPDCRQVFYEAYQNVVELGTRPETTIAIITPVSQMSKGDIVEAGIRLAAPLHLTWSCYKSESVACGRCDSCALRLRGFHKAGATDPIPYQE